MFFPLAGHVAKKIKLLKSYHTQPWMKYIHIMRRYAINWRPTQAPIMSSMRSDILPSQNISPYAQNVPLQKLWVQMQKKSYCVRRACGLQGEVIQCMHGKLNLQHLHHHDITNAEIMWELVPCRTQATPVLLCSCYLGRGIRRRYTCFTQVTDRPHRSRRYMGALGAKDYN